MSRTKEGSTAKYIYRGCTWWYTGKIPVTPGTPADCTQAGRLIEEGNADYLLGQIVAMTIIMQGSVTKNPYFKAMSDFK
jgi:hypothetical protein